MMIAIMIGWSEIKKVIVVLERKKEFENKPLIFLFFFVSQNEELMSLVDKALQAKD